MRNRAQDRGIGRHGQDVEISLVQGSVEFAAFAQGEFEIEPVPGIDAIAKRRLEQEQECVRAPGFELKGLLIGPGTAQSTMDAWYRETVIGGPSGFLIAAQGFEDFGRAFRQKFVTEISALALP